jgi:hypothetical protein
MRKKPVVASRMHRTCMTCPDENVFARVQASLLGASEVSAFHLHLDNCPDCLELASLLGCMDGMNEPIQRRSSNEAITQSLKELAFPGKLRPPSMVSNRRRRPLLAALGVTIMCHAYSSILLVPPLWQAFRADVTQGIFSYWPLRDIWLPFTLVWGSVGLLFAGVVLYASLFMARSPRFALRGYALLSLLTGVLAPVGLYLIVASRHFHARD